jgi:hypothetical protein
LHSFSRSRISANLLFPYPVHMPSQRLSQRVLVHLTAAVALLRQPVLVRQRL